MLLFSSWRGLFDTCWVSQPGFLSPSFVTKNSICSLRLPPRTAPPHWSPGLCLRNDFISWLALKSMEQQPLNICFYGYIFIHHMLSVIWGILHILFIYFCHREQFKRRKKKKKKVYLWIETDAPCVGPWGSPSPLFWEERWAVSGNSQALRIKHQLWRSHLSAPTVKH